LDEWFEIIKQYKDCVVTYLDRPVRLEKCHGCESEYYINFISLADYLKSKEAKSSKQQQNDIY
jgi:hypothetical protein